MRICFLPQTQDAPGCYRCIFPAEELRKRGHDAKQPHLTGPAGDALLKHAGIDRGEPIYHITKDPAQELGRIGAQVYVFHRQFESNIRGLMRMLRKERDAAIIVDSDDDDIGSPGYNPGEFAGRPYGGYNRGMRRGAGAGVRFQAKDAHRNNFLLSLREADAITVSTPYLAERLRRYNPEVHVLRNYLRWEDWEHAELQFATQRPRRRIGWMGRASTHGGDLRVLAGLIGPWLERHPGVDFVAAGDEDVHDILGVPEGQRVSYPPVHFRDLDLHTITATMDVGLVPLEANNFNEGKSHLKGMEYAACGIPCIATPTESYRWWVEEGENGLLAEKPRDWIKALDAIVGDDALRREMGRRARVKAYANSYEKNIGQWEELYTKLGREQDLADEAIQRGAVQKHNELKDFLDLVAGSKLKTIVEIGTARGGTFHALCQLAEPDACVISIDLPHGEFGGGYEHAEVPRLRGFAQPGQELHFLLADSHDSATLAELRRRLRGRTIDLLFIDGDHRYEGVKADFEMYAPLCSGIVAFHDIMQHPMMPDCKVDQLWGEVKDDYRHLELCYEGLWGGIGVLFMETAAVAA